MSTYGPDYAWVDSVVAATRPAREDSGELTDLRLFYREFTKALIAENATYDVEEWINKDSPVVRAYRACAAYYGDSDAY